MQQVAEDKDKIQKRGCTSLNKMYSVLKMHRNVADETDVATDHVSSPFVGIAIQSRKLSYG